MIRHTLSFEGKDVKSEGVIPSPVSLVAEEKVSFGLYALSVSSLTVARIRKVYNKLDSKAIAKQVSGTLLVHHGGSHWEGGPDGPSGSLRGEAPCSRV